MVWYGPTSETAWMQRRQKNWFKRADFTELKKITRRIYSNFSKYSLFFKSNKLRCCSFPFIKKNSQLTEQVCCLFYFLLHSTFFKGKVTSGFYCFFQWAFENTGWFSSVVCNYINIEDNCGRLIDFVNQI